MTHFETIDSAFRAILRDDSELRKIADGFTFTEGPAWSEADRALYFSDIPNNTIHRWSEADGLSVFRTPSRNANGNTFDREGRLISCEHGSRTVTRTEADGTETTLAATFGGRKLNSPNDVVVDSAGRIWFTDPPYGIKPEMSEQPANYLFRLDADGAEPAPVLDSLPRPNGLCFSPDERFLYVANSDKDQHNIWRFAVGDDLTLSDGEIFAVIEPWVPDGMRVDTQGNLYTTAGDGVQVFTPGGAMLGKILTPKVAANCTFGGADNRTLYITATDTVWAVDLAATGAKRP